MADTCWGRGRVPGAQVRSVTGYWGQFQGHPAACFLTSGMSSPLETAGERDEVLAGSVLQDLMGCGYKGAPWLLAGSRTTVSTACLPSTRAGTHPRSPRQHQHHSHGACPRPSHAGLRVAWHAPPSCPERRGLTRQGRERAAERHSRSCRVTPPTPPSDLATAPSSVPLSQREVVL